VLIMLSVEEVESPQHIAFDSLPIEFEEEADIPIRPWALSPSMSLMTACISSSEKAAPDELNPAEEAPTPPSSACNFLAEADRNDPENAEINGLQLNFS
jgi:hypothetical protein